MKANNKIEVTVGNAMREVTVNSQGPRYSTGYVGKAYFAWKSDQHDLPFVLINNKKADVRARQLVKLFLMEYKRMVLAARKSPLHFKESEAKETTTTSSSVNSDSISGVPEWMRSKHKVWTECKRKDGSTYMRRTRFKEESKDVVEEFLPHCSQCPFRVNCERPCEEPELMCESELFQEMTIFDEIKSSVSPIVAKHKVVAFYLNKNIKQFTCEDCKQSKSTFRSARYETLEDLLNAVQSMDHESVEVKEVSYHDDKNMFGLKESVEVIVNVKNQIGTCDLCQTDELEDAI